VPTGQSTGASTITVTANAIVDGLPLSQSGNATLSVRPVTTSFLGRTVVDDPLQTPIAGITIFMLGRNGSGQTTGCVGHTVSDAAGNFALTNLPASCVGDQLIAYDGSTATSPPGVYAGVNLAYTIVANQATVSPVLVHLPRIDDKETFLVRQNWPTDQAFTFRTIPNLSTTVYAGTTFTLPDGSRPDPFPLIAVQVPVDRLPDTMPPMPNALAAFIVAFQPANTTASQAVAVSFPNALNSPVGMTLELTTLDPTKGVMVLYGTGQVSSNGLQVIPDLNPATPGKRYGITNFDWHGPMFVPQPAINPVPSSSTCPGSDVPGGLTPDTKAPTCGKPIDVGTGLEMYSVTDLSFGSLRGTVSLQRTYRTLSNLAGPFGVGTGHNYGYAIDTAFPQVGAQFRLILPEGGRIPFAPQPDGTFTNTTAPVLRGMVARIQQDGRVALRLKDGTTYRFVTGFGALASSPLESVTDANGNVTALMRDGSAPQRITSITDPVGRSLTLAYDSNNRITSAADPVGRTVRYTYSSQGTLETVTDPEGGVTRYAYDTQNRLNQVTDPRGVVVAQNTFDANGRVIEQVQADGGRLQFEYTLFNPIAPTSPVQQTVVTDPLGNRTTYRFNPEGYLVDVTDASGQRHLIGREQGTNLVQVVAHGSSCAPTDRPEVTVLPRCTTADPSGPITSYTYDADGNVLTVRDPIAQLTRFEYSGPVNKVTGVTDALANLTRFEYDVLGNLTRTIDAKGNATQYAYDSHGLLSALTDPLHQTTNLAYDDFANLVSITNALGQVTTLRYDGVWRLVEVRDPVGRTSSTAYDALDRIVSETNGNKEATRFAYDAIGNLLSLTDARNNVTQFTYDGMSRLLTRTDPLGHADSRTYDRNGNLTQFVDRRGQTSSFTYDGMDRLVRETYQDSTVDRSYDFVGRLVAVDDSTGGSFAFTRDQAGRQLSAVGPFGTVRYTRDALGQVTSRQVVGQDAQTHTYDPVGNLLTSATPQAGVTFSYNARNEVQSLGRANGVTTNYSYDAVGRVLNIVHASASGTLASLQYTYDASGARVSQTSTTAQPLITQAVQQTFNNANQLLQSGGATYTYDENGNRLTETAASGTTTYTWDSRNRLVSIGAPSGQTTTFLYDFAVNLLSQRDAGPTTNRVQDFVLDQVTNVAYVSDSTSGQYSVVTAGAIDTHMATTPSAGAVYALTDAINSTVATSSASGTVESTLSYEPFGQALVSGAGFAFQFTGRPPISGSLVNSRSRFYDSVVGRFLSEDSFGFAAGDGNLYRYVGNRPAELRDPTGHFDYFGFNVGFNVLRAGGRPLLGLQGPSRAQPWWDKALDMGADALLGRSYACGGGYANAPRDYAHRTLPSDATALDQACQEHDAAINASRAGFFDLTNPAIASAHAQLAERLWAQGKWRGSLFFKFLGSFGRPCPD
jgi:RHS repeat-associated protein